MNRVTRRAWTVAVLAAVLLVGLIAFLFRYVRHGEEWATFFGSPHLYEAGNPTTGEVVDRNGTLLLDTESGREYTDDTELRKTVIHVLGDRFGYISAPLLSRYMDQMITYDPVDGLSDTLQSSRTARLTLDAGAQKTALAALEGNRGTVGVYNYRTGEILCLVTAPTYDPDNVPDISGDTSGQYEGVYVNRFFKSTYTPGSIFKAFTLSVALDTVPGIENRVFHCTGKTIIDGEVISCGTAHGDQTLEQAFRNSCNCAFAEITNLIPRETMEYYAEESGITESFETEGITVVAGNYSVLSAGDGSYAWSGVGQYTDQINPCSYMVFMGMLANGGFAAKPYLMADISDPEECFYAAETEFLSSGITPASADAVALMMRNNVVLKYGSDIFPKVCVCAKSGTAETTEGKEPNAMFAGFIDDDRYPLAFIVVVEEGGYGTYAAAPIAGKVLQACMDALDSEK